MLFFANFCFPGWLAASSRQLRSQQVVLSSVTVIMKSLGVGTFRPTNVYSSCIRSGTSQPLTATGIAASRPLGIGISLLLTTASVAVFV